ncbi:MAG TPA: leucine--tRNA ligase [Verrucomicrobiae bacterium]|nr:leucine--tRNA ligase [Verrucomicrobiae bacterium]
MYDHRQKDKYWQDKWEAEKLYATPENPDPSKKQYILDMFPYPSGAGLHVGHPIGYIGTDILSRFARMNGKHVLHPMGWDAFGLPAENYAIKAGVHPEVTTKQNTDRFREQLKMIGLSYDWSKEINTSQPEYYKWTQWLFLQLYKNGLAYKKEAYVNWCPKDQTVLANEQVINGCCDRCGSKVEQKLLSQWFFKITDYAERLLNDIEKVDWPEPIKQMQKNWIGRSSGARLKFYVKDSDRAIEIFTTRPDTLFGATYMVLAPEHPMVDEITTDDRKEVIQKYIDQTKLKSELERTALEKNKTGEFTGSYAINPATEEEIPIWIADYVLISYGSGAIMAVPAHDERDFEFAKKYNLPIKKVINAPSNFKEEVYTGEGSLINSGEYSLLNSVEARNHITADFGKQEVQYRLRDWLVSRQRYWGAPIPIIYCDEHGMQPVSESDLPVKLPTDVDFKPTGESPLVYSKEFHNVTCPICSKPARRDSDTMDTFVDSSWYFFRYTDVQNQDQFANQKHINEWMPIDTYVGGADHAVLHLLYSRFITKALIDLNYLPKDNFKEAEPFIKLRNQGNILGPDGQKMSKSKGNVINPDDVINEYGADSLRMYEMFMGPFEDAKPWSTQGIVGVRRFLDRVVKFQETFKDAQNVNIHKLTKKITSDITSMKFNTAVAAFMEFLNENPSMSKDNWETFLKLLAPFAPHISEELWLGLGHDKSIHLEFWPIYDPSLILESEITLVVQVLGKTRGTLTVKRGLTQEEAKQAALELDAVKKQLEGKEVIKEVFVPDKLINFVVK